MGLCFPWRRTEHIEAIFPGGCILASISNQDLAKVAHCLWGKKRKQFMKYKLTFSMTEHNQFAITNSSSKILSPEEGFKQMTDQSTFSFMQGNKMQWKWMVTEASITSRLTVPFVFHRINNIIEIWNNIFFIVGWSVHFKLTLSYLSPVK